MKKKIQIKTDKDLFDRWKLLGSEVSGHKAVVQNDMEVSREEIIAWLADMNALKAKLRDLVADTAKHISKAVSNSK